MNEIPQREVTGKWRLKRGAKIPAPDKMKLKFKDFINRANLPVVPKVFGHLKAAAPPGGWGMLGNADYGDCVMAGAAHEHMLWAWATGRPIPPFTAPVVIKQYLHLTGGQDTGLDPVDAASWRTQTGLTDAAGITHKIDAAVQIDDLDELALAVYLGGVAAFCWLLPANAEQQFAHEHVWDDLGHKPDPQAGHYTACGGKNSRGMWEFLTWGRIQGATEHYVEKYAAPGACLAYLSQEYMMETGSTPEAIKWADLSSAIRSLA